MNYKNIIIIAFSLVGCSANKVELQAKNIELVIEKPDDTTCTFLGEVVGSQGNWFTDGYTSSKNLIIGARNELRNEAYQLGGNIVYIQHIENTNAADSAGIDSSTIIGKAYKCIR